MLPSDISVKQFIQHVLNAKVTETNEIQSLSPVEMRRMLMRDFKKVISSATDPESKKQGLACTSHLREWSEVLKA